MKRISPGTTAPDPAFIGVNFVVLSKDDVRRDMP